jgi:hypothetical protein
VPPAVRSPPTAGGPPNGERPLQTNRFTDTPLHTLHTGSLHTGSLPAAIAGIVSRHPMRFQQLASTLADCPPAALCAALADLEAHGIVRPVDRLGLRFWAAAAAHFPAPPQPPNSLAS